MRYEIRAMSFAEILDMGFRLLRDQFVLIVGLAATLQVPLVLLQTWAGESFIAGAMRTGRIVAWVLTVLGVVIVAPTVGAAVTFALGETYLGRGATMGESLRRAFGILLPLGGTMLLLWLVTVAPFIVLVGVPLLVLFVAPGLLEVFGDGRALLVPLAVIPALILIYLMLAFMLTTQVMVLENTFGFAALRRSRFLMRGNLLRGAGITFLGAMMVGVLSGILGFALGFIPFVGKLGAGLAQAAATAYTSAVLVVLYFDIRCRKEAFDLEHLARVVAARDEPTPAAAGSPA